MGSWSVACGISNIAITAGNKCVLIPLQKNNERIGYFKYIPSVLPIFGEYNDYGGIENIEKNLNTELIEKASGVSIEEFCEYLVDGIHTYDRDEAKEINKRINNSEIMSSMRFMWMDRQVFDFMTSNTASDYNISSFMGSRVFLETMGFRKLEIKSGKDRYTQVWEKDGMKINTDGQWIQIESGQGIYYLKDSYSRDTELSNYFNLNAEQLAFTDIYSFQELMNEKEATKYLFPDIFGRYSDVDHLLDRLRDSGIKGELKSIPDYLPKKFLLREYSENIMLLKKEFSQVGRIYRNLHCMSGTFRPHELYLTPQCGEHRAHQVLLEKFAEINKSYCDD